MASNHATPIRPDMELEPTSICVRCEKKEVLANTYLCSDCTIHRPKTKEEEELEVGTEVDLTEVDLEERQKEATEAEEDEEEEEGEGEDEEEPVWDLTPEQELLLPFTDGITVLTGSKGQGKTTAAVALAYSLKKHFGLPVVSDFNLKEPFGDFIKIDLKSFIADLRLISAELSVTQSEAALDSLMNNNHLKIPLNGCVMILDEGYQYMESRTPNDKVVRLFGYWIQQIRHYRVSLLFITPHLDMIDKRMVRQIDRLGTSMIDRRRGRLITTYTDMGTHKLTQIIAEDISMYWAMFDSWGLFQFRETALNIQKV